MLIIRIVITLILSTVVCTAVFDIADKKLQEESNIKNNFSFK
jgi:hypothetical protein